MPPDTDLDTGPALSGEAAADLRALQLAADADPNELPDPNEPPPPPPPPPLDKEIAGLVLMLSKMLTPAFPSIGRIYTDEVCDSVGAAVAPVCDKYGWMQDGVGGEYGPEIMCVCVVGPLAFATYTAVQNDLAERRAKDRTKGEPGQLERPQPAPGALRTPGSDTVTVGAVIE